MKQRLTSVFLVLTMIFSLIPAFTVSVSAGVANLCKIGSTEYTDIESALRHGGSDSSEKDPNTGESDSISTTIVLIDNVTENVTIPSGRNITIDLNGYVLEASSGSVITNNGTLTISDSNPNAEHKFTEEKITTNGNTGYYWKLSDAGTLTTTGGIITGGTGTLIPVTNPTYNYYYGGGIYNTGSLFLIGGTIIGNHVNNTTNSDCSSGGGIYNEGSVVMSGGYISHNCSMGNSIKSGLSSGGGGVFNIGNFTLENGSISNNYAVYGGGVVCGNTSNSSTFKLMGGSVKNNNASQGGGFYLAGNFEMNGGNIIANRSITSGGGVYCSNTYKPVYSAVITGGNITSNIGKEGGGIFCNNYYPSSCPTIGGNLNITGNMLNDEKTASNLYSYHANDDDIGVYISTTVPPVAKDENDLSKPYMNIGVTIAKWKQGAVTGTLTAANSADYTNYFFSDNPLFEIANGTENQVILKYHEHDSITFDKLFPTNGGELTTGNYFLVEDVDLSKGSGKSDITIPTGNEVNICLNGHVLKGTGKGSVIKNSGTLTIMDCDAAKDENHTVHYFTYNDDAAWVYIAEPTDAQKSSAIAVENIDSATLKSGTTVMAINGGLITGGAGTNEGGGIYNTGTLTMSNGTICGCTANTNGGGIYYSNGTVTVSGSTKIIGNGKTAAKNNLYLSSGKTVTVNAPLAGMSIGVTTQTVPADAAPVAITGANSTNYSSNFKSDNKNYEIFNDGSDSNQVVKLKPHSHNWSYTVTGAAITAVCSGGICSNTDTTLTISAQNATYDGAVHGASFGTASSFCGSTVLPTISYEYKAEANGTYVTTTSAINAGYYKASFTVGTGQNEKTAYVEYRISPIQLAIAGTSVKNKEYDGTKNASATLGILSGVLPVDADKVNVAAKSAEFSDKNAGASKTVTVKYSISGTAAGNYLAPVDDSSLSADISKKQLTIADTTVPNKDYDGTTAADPTLGTVDGIVSGDQVTVAVDTATFNTKDVGTGKDVSIEYKLTGSDVSNYVVPGGETKTADIMAKPINVSADNKSSLLGAALVPLTYTADNLCSGDNFSGELATNADKDVLGNTYTITQGTLTAGSNYAITFTPGIYTVGTKYTVSFDENGGSKANTIYDIEANETITIPETTKTGYTFKEWNTKADGTGNKLESTTKITASTTYSAIWTPNTYTITFNANGGAGNMDPQTFTYDAQQALKANSFTNNGASFVGWGLSANAKSPVYIDGASIINLTTAANENINLYAVWSDTPVFSISGMVQQNAVPTAKNVSNALVELKRGQNIVASTHTDTNGDYILTGITPGEYNIVVTGHASGTADKTKTTLVVLENSNKSGVDILLPQGDVSSLVEVKPNTPQVLVGGLDDEAVSQAGSNLSDKIRVVLSVESVEDITNSTTASPSAIAAQVAIKEEASGKTVEFIEMDVTKYVNTNDSAIHETSNVLEIIIPFTTEGRNDISVYRFHDADNDGILDAGQQIALTRLDARPTAPYTDGTYYVGDGFIVIYTKYFSAYAIGYTVRTPRTPGDSDYTAPKTLKFVDVFERDYFYDAVYWAVEKDVTSGTDETHFSPRVITNRAQMVTFLWRCLGRPKAKGTYNPFVDVKEGSYYYDAVIWGVENGVVKGTTKTTFSPNQEVTRGQAMAFIARHAGVEDYAPGYSHSFTDVRLNSYYSNAISWASTNGITSGKTLTTFAPDEGCQRAHIVVFLYNYFNK